MGHGWEVGHEFHLKMLILVHLLDIGGVGRRLLIHFGSSYLYQRYTFGCCWHVDVI